MRCAPGPWGDLDLEHEASPWLMLTMALMVALFLSLFAIISTRKLKLIPETRLQTLVELIVGSLDDFVRGIIGPKGRKYTPFVGTLFIYILGMNLLGLVPPFQSPTANLSITASLAVAVFFAYNYAAIREAGLKSWGQHLIGEPVWLAPIMLPIHVIGEFARPISLSIRLFGNIFGEETVLMILGGMTVVIVPYLIAIPTQFPIMVLKVFISFVQALVFAMLSAIYISLGIADHAEH